MRKRVCVSSGLATGILLAIGTAAADPPPASEPAASQTAPSEPAATEKTAWDLALQGRQLLKEKNPAGAIVSLQAALARAEQDGLAAEDQGLLQYLLSLSAQKAGQDELALTAIRAAVRLAPTEADYQLDLANQLFAADKNQDAKQHAEEALRRKMTRKRRPSWSKMPSRRCCTSASRLTSASRPALTRTSSRVARPKPSAACRREPGRPTFRRRPSAASFSTATAS
jgi:tetratricopeptide (TPR) repeat protein